MAENPPEWAYERAGVLHREFTGDNYLPDLAAAYGDLKGAFARYIAEHEEPPVDPLLIEAREIVGLSHPHAANDWRSFCREGCYDNGAEVSIALAALKRGMELAKDQQS